nr:MAG TPA: hypothetical protein [Caudoviricetes sp.]
MEGKSNGCVTPHKPPVTAVNAVSLSIPRIERPVRLKEPPAPR